MYSGDPALPTKMYVHIIQFSGTPIDYGVDTPKSEITHFSVIFFTHLGLDHLVFAHVILENLKEVRRSHLSPWGAPLPQ